MYIDNAVEHAWAKKQHIAFRLNEKDHEELKTRIIHQLLTHGLWLADENDLIVGDLYQRRGESKELSEIFSVPDVDLLWDLGTEMQDFDHYFPEKEDFIDALVLEVEFWSPDLVWSIKDPERKRRREFAKVALQNSDIEIDPMEFEDDED